MIEMREVKIGSIDYSGGGQKYLDLPKDFAMLALRLRLAGRCVISGGSSSGTPWTENPMTLIERIRIFGSKAGGAVEIVNLGAAELYELSHILDETAYEKTAITSGGAATTDFVCDINVPLHIKGKKIDLGSKVMSMLPSWLFSDLQLEVKFRDGTATTGGGLISGGDRSIALTAYGSGSGVPSVSVVAQQAENVKRGEFRPALMKLYKKTLVTEAVESARKEPLNRGNFFRLLMVKAFSDTAERATSASILQNIRLLVSGNAKRDWPFAQLAGDNKSFYGLETMPTGYAVLDFVKHGDTKTMLNTADFVKNGTSLEMELNINGTSNNRVDVIACEVIKADAW